MNPSLIQPWLNKTEVPSIVQSTELQNDTQFLIGEANALSIPNRLVSGSVWLSGQKKTKSHFLVKAMTDDTISILNSIWLMYMFKGECQYLVFIFPWLPPQQISDWRKLETDYWQPLKCLCISPSFCWTEELCVLLRRELCWLQSLRWGM